MGWRGSEGPGGVGAAQLELYMPRVDKCAKCGSSAITQRVMVAEKTQAGEIDLSLRAVILKKSTRSKLHAHVCSSCGYVEFYAGDPKMHES